MSERLLPVGIQSFEKLRENHCVYVDKTEYVYKLVHDVVLIDKYDKPLLDQIDKSELQEHNKTESNKI